MMLIVKYYLFNCKKKKKKKGIGHFIETLHELKTDKNNENSRNYY